ncbi:MAG: tetratricopeptide repeat protein, partial [Candidatus Hodarchaeota archaeon]
MKWKTPIIALLILVVYLPRSAPCEECRKTMMLYNQGTMEKDLLKREQFFREALTLSCTDDNILAKIHNNLADTYEKSEKYNDAIGEYKRAVELDPKLLTPYLSLGDLYSKIGDFGKANANYNKYYELMRVKDRKHIRSSLSLRSPTRSIRPVPAENLYFDLDNAELTQ